MHEMLEDALAPLVEQGRPLDDVALQEAISRLRTRGRAIWEEAPAKHAFGRVALWRYEADAAIDGLEALLLREAQLAERFGMTSVAGGERRFAQPLPGIDPPLLVQARLDRIDRGGDAIQVVDYKTGRFIRKSEVEDGHRLQLQLYALVARAELGARRLVARYAFLRPASDWWLDSDDPEDAAIIEDAAWIASEIRENVSAGVFQVAPEMPECPRYCAARTLCRVNHFSRSKTWR